jgi:hypothetical protein
VKLSDLDLSDAPPIRSVPLKLANSEKQIDVGLKLLTGSERATIIRKAKAAARDNGADKWDDDDPACVLELWVETVAVACVDVDSDPNSPEPFFASSDEVRSHQFIGEQNIQYLAEVHQSFEEEMSIRPSGMDEREALVIAWQIAESEGGSQKGPDPLDGMRLGTLRTFARFMASLLWNSPSGKSQSSLDDFLSTELSKIDSPKQPRKKSPKPKARKPRAKKARETKRS